MSNGVLRRGDRVYYDGVPKTVTDAEEIFNSPADYQSVRVAARLDAVEGEWVLNKHCKKVGG